MLGGGGLVGQAFHAGVLAALEVDLGWSPALADVVVGTSAGAITGAMIRWGVAPTDMALWSRGHGWPADDELLNDLDRVRRSLPSVHLGVLLRRWRLSATRSYASSTVRDRAAAVSLLPSVLPTGSASLRDLAGRHLPPWVRATWPRGLWICAVCRDDGSLTVFGRDAIVDVDLLSAIAASSAIPAVFAPVTLDGRTYVDGCFRSPTNADQLLPERMDTVVIISPLSSRTRFLTPPWQRFAHRRLRQEIASLEESGSEVVCFEPDDGIRRLMGINLMDTRRVRHVLSAGFFHAARTLAQDGERIRTLLGLPVGQVGSDLAS